MSSLQDQLLKAGLVDPKQAKQVSKEKRKAAKVAKRSKNTVDEKQVELERQRAEKAERDRELNRKRQGELEQRAIAAQIQQLIASNKQPQLTGGADLEFHFKDANVIKRLRVDRRVNQQLVNGQLGVVKGATGYELVPRVVAEKIRERDDGCVLVLNQAGSQQDVDEDDPYKDYQIPDDLMW